MYAMYVCKWNVLMFKTKKHKHKPSRWSERERENEESAKHPGAGCPGACDLVLQLHPYTCNEPAEKQSWRPEEGGVVTLWNSWRSSGPQRLLILLKRGSTLVFLISFYMTLFLLNSFSFNHITDFNSCQFYSSYFIMNNFVCVILILLFNSSCYLFNYFYICVG